MTPEFHTMGNISTAGQRTIEAARDIKKSRPYKATVMLFLAGGADTFNMLVPMDYNLYNEYLQVRADIALQPSQLHAIETEGQACGQFGIHHKLPILKELYDRKKAAFVSNVGALVEPTTKQQWEENTASTCVGLFSHSDQKTAAQTLKCQVAGSSPKGVGGRFADALSAENYKATSFSIAGAAAWSQGYETNIDIIHQ